MSDFDLDDVLKAIKDKVPGAFEVYQSLEFFGYRQVRHGNPEISDRKSLVSVDVAETDTGITAVQVSRWRQWLRKEADYRDRLRRAPYRKAMAEDGSGLGTKSEAPDGRQEKFLIKVLDAGPSGGDQRYHVRVTTEGGGSATGNPADDIIGTLFGVHMWDLDRVDAEG